MSDWTSRRPIVVGVDGSEQNRSAVGWAVAEAARTSRELVLVTVVDDRMVPVPHFGLHAQEEHARRMMHEIGEEVHRTLSPELVHTQVLMGSATDVLLEQFPDAVLTVVGKRGLGAFSRLLVGSTSLAVAGRSRSVVAVVPDVWKQEDHVAEPIVLGVDPYRPDHHPLHLAFSRAERLGVPLLAVHGWEAAATYSWEDVAMADLLVRWERESEQQLDQLVNTWRTRFPDVDVHAHHAHNHPASAVLDAAEHAQLVVLGRHGDHRHGGFAFGSVTRAVLHYTECPVLVVPTEEQP